MEIQLVYILIGGGLGSIGRYLISQFTPQYYKGDFPLGTFTANIIGCLIIGIFVAILKPNTNLDACLVTGFCGGFTTFSSFSKEVFLLFDTKKTKLAFVYVISSSLFGILAVLLGYTLSGGHF